MKGGLITTSLMPDDIHFYSKIGQPICYSSDGEHLYLWDGSPIGYIDDERVFSFSGRALGWFIKGWLYDRNCNPALFSEYAEGGPTIHLTS